MTLTATILFAICISPLVSAAAAPDRSLGISPLRREVDITAGTTYASNVLIKNSGKNNLSIKLSAEVFSVTNESYDYSFNATDDATQWVHFSPNSFDLQSGQSQIVNYSISVPIGSESGGRYLSLFATSNPAQDKSGVDSVERVASLVYITIPGNISRIGNVLTLKSPAVIFSSGVWSASVQNKGTSHFRSVYSVTIKSLFGQTMKSNETSALILPSSVRLISGDVPMPKWIGLYKVTYSIGLGDKPADVETRWVLYAPTAQLIVVCCIAGAFVLLVVTRRNKR